MADHSKKDTDKSTESELVEIIRHLDPEARLARVALDTLHSQNNLFTVILGMMNHISGNNLSEEDRIAFEQMKESTEKCVKMNHSILNWKRRMSSQDEYFHIGQLLKTVASLPHKTSADLALTMEYHPMYQNDLIRGLEINFMSDIMNLIANSKNALVGVRSPYIHLHAQNLKKSEAPNPYNHTASHEELIRLSITDNGCGISPEDIPHIWNRGFSKKGGASYGTGLSSVIESIANQAGYIDVESKVGFGTTFHIYLPTAPERIFTTTLTKDPLKILYLDDDMDLLNVITQQLERRGHKVTKVANSQQAIQKYLSPFQTYDVVLTDLALGEAIDGVDVARMFKNHASTDLYKDCPIVMITGYSKQVIVDDEKQKLFVDYILKPAKSVDLIQKIEKAAREYDYNRNR